MLYLIPAVATSLSILVIFKILEKYNISLLQTITINYFFALIIGYFSISQHINFDIFFTTKWLYQAIILGVSFIITFIIFGLSSQKAGISITAIASKMSVIIPIAVGLFFLNEDASFIKIIGIFLALLSFYLCLKKENSVVKYSFLPILLFVGNGLNDTLLKLAQLNMKYEIEIIYFLIIIFTVALLIGLIIVLLKKDYKISFKSILTGLIIGILNWYSTYFFVKGLSIVDVSVFIPLFNILLVLSSVFIGIIVFSEKLRWYNFVGIGMAIMAIIALTH